MAKFLFQAKNQAGQMQTGSLEAKDETELRVMLSAKSLQPVKLMLVQGGAGKKASGLESFFSPGDRRPSGKDLLIFTRQLATLINAGIPIVDCLKILSDGKKASVIKDAAGKVKYSIEQGKRLGESMAAMPHVFDKFFVNMVRAGEEAGILDTILMRLAVYMEKSDKIKKQITSAMFYPGLIVIAAIAVVSAILLFVVPQFQELYSSAGQELPKLTQIVVGMSNVLKTKWYFVIGFFVAVPVLFVNYYRTTEGKNLLDSIFIQIPVFGDLIQKSAIAKMTRTLSTLLSSGVGVIEAIEIASKTAGNKVIEDALLRCKDSLIQGRPLAAPLLKEKIIPDMVTQMISIGEQSGTLDTMLGKIADFYEDDVENAVKAVTSMIEPIMMIFIGGIIAFLVMALYLPIMNMSNMMGGG